MLAAPIMNDLSLTFVPAVGSVRGREHERTGRNNQDAWALDARATSLVAVVTDGCGSGSASEVGARLGARLLTAAISRRLIAEPNSEPTRLLEAAALDTLAVIDETVRRMGGDYVNTLVEHFLFTVVGAVVQPRETVLFALGDGLLGINGSLRQLEFAGNAPPYLSYALIPDAVNDLDLVRGIDVVLTTPTRALRSLVLATDGAAQVPDLVGTADDPRLIDKPHLLQRRLNVLNRERTRVDWQQGVVRREAGALADDTTVLVLKRTTPREDV